MSVNSFSLTENLCSDCNSLHCACNETDITELNIETVRKNSLLHSHHIHSETSHQVSEIEEVKDKNAFNEINDDSIFQSDIILLNNTVHKVSDDNSVSRSMLSKAGNLDFIVMASEFEDNADSSHSTSNRGNLKYGSLDVCGIKRRARLGAHKTGLSPPVFLY